jgi:hypothetical protein
MRKHVIQKMEKLEAPDSILKDAGKRITQILKELSDRGIDGEAYINSPKGMAEYLIYCSDEEQRDEVFLRCGGCLFYHLFDSGNDSCSKYKFTDETPKPILCNDFQSCGYDYYERVQRCIDQCWKCSLYKKDEGFGGACKENHDSFAIECPFLKLTNEV